MSPLQEGLPSSFQDPRSSVGRLGPARIVYGWLVSLLWLMMCVPQRTDVAAQSPYVINLDVHSWDKLIFPTARSELMLTTTRQRPLQGCFNVRPHVGVIKYVIIRFDVEFPHGPERDAFDQFASIVANA